MSVRLRVRGWLTDGTIAVPPNTVEAMAELVEDVRDLSAENARLTAHSAALRAITEAITKHGHGSERANDAYRDALAALKVE